MKTGCMECTTREAREIEFHPDNANGEEGFSQSKAWRLLQQMLRE
jgi:hypothetical protein